MLAYFQKVPGGSRKPNCYRIRYHFSNAWVTFRLEESKLNFIHKERQRFNQFFGPYQDYKRKDKMNVYKINHEKKHRF